jgi:hypothetical protein
VCVWDSAAVKEDPVGAGNLTASRFEYRERTMEIHHTLIGFCCTRNFGEGDRMRM